MHIVANAGAIRRRIVGTEHRQWRAPAQSGINRQRDQMGFRLMVLPQPAIRVGAGRVEVA